MENQSNNQQDEELEEAMKGLEPQYGSVEEEKIEDIGDIKPEEPQVPHVDLKLLPKGLKYEFLDPDKTYPVIVSDEFQCCMMAVFSEFIKEIIEVFMDDFSVYGKTFVDCMANLDKVLTRCAEVDLVLNWEKCHFMVKQGIMLGHVISERGIEVDKAKVETVEQHPPPTDVKSLRRFLGHAGFYRRFIKDFSKITKPLTQILLYASGRSVA
jgi:hypothetical protein